MTPGNQILRVHVLPNDVAGTLFQPSDFASELAGIPWRYFHRIGQRDQAVDSQGAAILHQSVAERTLYSNQMAAVAQQVG
jgi:hypothetical protein